MSEKILVIGSSNTDMIVQVSRIPRPGETILGGKYSTAQGGKGANQAVAASRAGGEVTLITKLGTDSLGQDALHGFRQANLNVDHIMLDPTSPSGVALIFVADDGENSIAVASGANATLIPEDIEKLESLIKETDILLMQLEIPLETVRTAAKIAFRNRTRVILNPAPARDLDPELLGHVSILTPNQTEMEILTGIQVATIEQARLAGQKLLDIGVETIVLTMGSKGAVFINKDTCQSVDGFSVISIDATGAGDTFSGSLAVALAENRPLADAIRFANSAAALSVTRLGAQPSIPNRAEVDKFLQENS